LRFKSPFYGVAITVARWFEPRAPDEKATSLFVKLRIATAYQDRAIGYPASSIDRQNEPHSSALPTAIV
jgi:hypothetical protein